MFGVQIFGRCSCKAGSHLNQVINVGKCFRRVSIRLCMYIAGSCLIQWVAEAG